MVLRVAVRTRPTSLKLFACGQPVLGGDAHPVEAHVGLPDRSRGALAVDHARLIARGVRRDQEALHVAVVVRARPDDHDVRDRGVPDPALGAVDHVVVAVAACPGVERHRVRAVLGFGQREGADRLQARHRRQPALPLLLGAKHRDRLHREPRLHSQERPEAPVAPVQLHVDQARGQRGHARAAVAVDVLPDDAELGEPFDQRPGQLGALPVVVDGWQDLRVDEPPRGDEVLPLLVAELLADQQVVGGERLTEVCIRHGGGHGVPPSSSAVSAATIAAEPSIARVAVGAARRCRMTSPRSAS